VWCGSLADGMSSHVEELCKLFVFPGKGLETSFTSVGLRGWKPRPQKTPLPGDGEWGMGNGVGLEGMFVSEAGLLAATEDEG
jgi:hypothetical protein